MGNKAKTVKALDDRKERAIALRRKGFVFNEILEKVNAAKSSISLWTRDVRLTKRGAERLKMRLADLKRSGQKKGSLAGKLKWEKLREIERQIGRDKAKKPSVELIKLCMLYWAEGTKKRNTMSFANTDAEMIREFNQALMKEMGVKQKDMKVEFVYHEDVGNAPKKKAQAFWAKLLKRKMENVLPIKNMDTRPRTGWKKNRHENGMCVLTVTNYRVVQQIYGALEGLAKVKIDPVR